MTGDATTAESTEPTRGGTGAQSADEPTEGDEGEGLTRRSFVRTAGGVAAAGATAAVGADEASAQAETYEFGGEVAAWHGRSPSAIEGQENPTVELEAGTEYEFRFENLDGAPHDMTLQDSQGNAIAQSEQISNEGTTASVTFTATPQMVQYVCTIHPTTMVGDVEVTGELEGGGGLPIRSLVLVAGLALAFVSPLLFALFLFSRDRDRAGETPAGR